MALACDGQTVPAWVGYEVESAIPVPEALRDAIHAYEGLTVS